jgi:hypothetical protein
MKDEVLLVEDRSDGGDKNEDVPNCNCEDPFRNVEGCICADRLPRLRRLGYCGTVIQCENRNAKKYIRIQKDIVSECMYNISNDVHTTQQMAEHR